MGLSRRDLLKSAGGLVIGVGFGGLALSTAKNAIGQGTEKQATVPDLPWPYKKLDPMLAAEDGYNGFYKGACCYGVFEAIISQLRKEIGFPYTVMPTTLLVVGQGGTADTAALCGALNGAANAIFLVTGGMDPKKRELPYSIIQEVFQWYEQTGLPDYRPKKPKFDIVKSVSRSNLCHVSVSKWCKTSKFKSFSKERSERCAWLTGSVAKYTVEQLNKYADGAFKVAHPLPQDAQTCRSCHDKGGVLENARGITDCGGCHFTPRKNTHPKI